MDAEEPSTIADLSSQCQQMFTSLKREILSRRSSDAHDKDSFLEGFVAEDALDSFARFHVWTGNIGALQWNKSSLDHRIRHSTVKDEVARLLTQLLSALVQLKSLVTGEREQDTWYTGDSVLSDEVDYDSDTSESEPHHGISEEDGVLVTESGQLSLIIGDAVASLLRLSIIIQRSSRQAKFAKSSREKPYDSRFDVLHVQESFPYAARNYSLVEKLGKANAQRRQWLSYRRQHREKLSSPPGPMGGYPSDLYPPNDGCATNPPSTISFSSRGPQGSPTVDNSTVATTFYEEHQQSHHASNQEQDPSETAYSLSSNSGLDKELALIPQAPPEFADGRPFECPLCFTFVCVGSLHAWIKHVHTDLASYVCTFEHCAQPLFESRHQWFHHEMEVHRRNWTCQFCGLSVATSRAFEDHLTHSHSSSIHPDRMPSLVQLASQPLQRIPASACPLCDYQEILQARLGVSEIILVKPAQFRNHLGHHLEQLALFVLPKSALIPDDNEDLRSNSPSKVGSPQSVGTDDRSGEENEETKPSEHAEASLEDVLSTLNFNAEPTPHRLKSAPDLALGWQPPHDFTPPAAAFETDDLDLIPRREEPMFGGDLFTPGWVRGYDKHIEGYCARCEVGHWLNIPDGTYEFHLTYLHGLPSTGLPLPRPSVIREIKDMSGVWEGYCDICEAWRTLKKTPRGWNWFRHCLTEHEVNSSDRKSIEHVVTVDQSGPDLTLINDAISYIRKGDSYAYKHLVSAQPRIVLQHDFSSKILLHYAAESGSTEMVHCTLGIHNAQGLAKMRQNNIDAQTSNGMTPMMLAAGQGHQDVVKELLKAGANINITNIDNHTALDLAAHAGYGSIAELLVSWGADIKKSRIFRGLYMRPAKRESPRLTATPEPSNQLKHYAAGWDDLMISAYDNDIDALKRCLEAGIDVEATAPDGRTALMISAEKGNKAIIEMLLAMGANINTTNNKGWTALMIAVKNTDHPMVQLLLSHGADVNHSSVDHWTALAEAAQQASAGIMQSLLACGADPESRSSHDWTPLMHACYIGDKRGVDLLLAAGASLEQGSQRDESPMLLAAAAGHTEIVRTLLNTGCMPESSWASKIEAGLVALEPARNRLERAYPLGWTPLMVACQGGHEEIVHHLLEAEANIEPKSPMERTALEIARENGRTSIVRILEKYIQSGA